MSAEIDIDHHESASPGVVCALSLALVVAAFGVGCFVPAVVVEDMNKLAGGQKGSSQIAKTCGNGACDTHRYETCAQCPQDCGPCEAGEPDLVALVPKAGPAQRWVSIFGLRLGAVQRLWLVHPSQGRTSLRHRRRGTALQVYIPARSKGGVIYIQVGGRAHATSLRYRLVPIGRGP